MSTRKKNPWLRLFVISLVAIGIAVTFAVLAKAVILLIR